MKYQTQKIALAYFAVAMALFAVQILGGVLAGYVYVMPNTLSELLPFNIIRMLHTNSLIVWLLLGFFGAAYFLIPEEAEREIHSPTLAYLQLIILVVGTLGVVVTYVFNLFEGNWLLGKEGREFLEQPKWVKAGIVVAALMFLYNVTMTVLKGKKDRDFQHPHPGSLGLGASLPLCLLQPGKPGRGQAILVVCRPPLGRRRVGAYHGLDPGLPHAETHRR